MPLPDGAAALQSLTVSVTDPSELPPQHGTNESYTLVVPGDGAAATLDAATVYVDIPSPVEVGHLSYHGSILW
jgi:hypothetical protein